MSKMEKCGQGKCDDQQQQQHQKLKQSTTMMTDHHHNNQSTKSAMCKKEISNVTSTTAATNNITTTTSISSLTMAVVSNHVPPITMRRDEKLVAELKSQIPDVENIFNVHYRIGEGTFSTVFLASLKCHENVPHVKRKYFAVKHLIPTSHPSRVERELRCLTDIGGIDNVVGVNLCLRRRESVCFVMPYVQHDKFQEYFTKLTARELQSYMENLLIALRRVHSFGIIHRDVKPSNFLHDRKNQKYLLVDFGLAQNVNLLHKDNKDNNINNSSNCNNNNNNNVITDTAGATEAAAVVGGGDTTVTTAASVSTAPATGRDGGGGGCDDGGVRGTISGDVVIDVCDSTSTLTTIKTEKPEEIVSIEKNDNVVKLENNNCIISSSSGSSNKNNNTNNKINANNTTVDSTKKIKNKISSPGESSNNFISKNSNLLMSKKRKASEIEETENHSSKLQNIDGWSLTASTKRPRYHNHHNLHNHQQQQHHQQQQQQSQQPKQVGDNSEIIQNENASQEMQQQQQQLQHEQEQEQVSSQEQQQLPVQEPNTVTIPSPFKTPLKQINEISTPKKNNNKFKTTHLDSPLTRHIKSAVLGYSITSKLENQKRSLATPRQSLINRTNRSNNNNNNNNNNNTQPPGSTPNSPTRAPSQQQTPTTPLPINTNNNKPQPPTSTTNNTTSNKYNTDNRKIGNSNNVACYCYGKPTICNICIIKKEIHASRAGTPGYRPPEVLLKYPFQTTAVDMWAIGVIMISILSACYPFFKGNDDFTALAEMITIFGDEAVKKTALSLSRHICTSQKKKPLHLRKLCVRLRNRSAYSQTGGGGGGDTKDTNDTPSGGGGGGGGGIGIGGKHSGLKFPICDNCQQIDPECLCLNSPLNMDFSNDHFPDSAYDLMSKLLTLNPSNRISAEEALKHPFFQAEL